MYLSATEQEVKAGKKVPVCTKSVKAAATQTAVIVGGGAGGLITAEALRSVLLNPS